LEGWNVNEIIGIVSGTLASAAILVGAVSWMMKGVMHPMKSTLEENNKALLKVNACLDEHGVMLVDHHVRIAKIETVHDTKGCT
jgi:hypothetical protein